MPEGDTVWRAAQRLNDVLAGERIEASDFRIPSLATADISEHTAIEVLSRGKHLLFRFQHEDSQLTLHTHFQMDGSWHIYPKGERWRGGPMHSIRVVLRTRTHDIVGYRLPVIELLKTADEESAVGHLGIDIMSQEWDINAGVAAIAGDPQREIGLALLDQRLIAGIGNLYRCEALFIRKTNPWAVVGSVDVEGIVETAANLMHRNRWQPRQITTGDERRGYEHYVHARGGRPCLRCGTKISVLASGNEPQDRLVYWCPRCQAC